MRRVLATFLAAVAAAPVFAQQPTGTQPPPKPPTGATGAPASTGGGMAITPVEPPKPAGIPVPEGPVVHKEELEGGLIIEDIKIGEGYEVKPGGAVVANYHGTLKSDGSVFDSSFNRGEPVAFPLSQVIPGWQKGVPGMKIGGVRRLTIPAAMAYGASARPGIPANSDLVFVIQLVDAVQTKDIKEGTGDAAEGSFVAVTAHTFKDKDGKVVGTADAAHPYIWIPRENQGVLFGLEGMKPGGKRVINIPKEMNNVSPIPDTDRPANVPLTMEVELIAVKNLQPKRPAMPPTPPTPPAPAGAAPATGGATGAPGATGAKPATGATGHPGGGH
jgi:FKBP-type peptidyl-prolyl cis-trans isomerase